MSRSWMAESREMNLSSFIGYCQIALQSSCFNLRAYQRWVRTFAVLIKPYWHLVLKHFKVFPNLIGMT